MVSLNEWRWLGGLALGIGLDGGEGANEGNNARCGVLEWELLC